MPTTTSHEVGWPWPGPKPSVAPAVPATPSEGELKKVPLAPTLEIFGKQARGQGDVLKYVSLRYALSCIYILLISFYNSSQFRWFGASEALP